MDVRRVPANAIFNLVGKRTRASKALHREIRSLIRERKLLQFQDDHIAALLSHAQRNVPYYSDILTDRGLLNKDEFSLSTLERIPLLTKKDIQEKFADLTSTDKRKRKWHCTSTGGSTGEPVRVIQDSEFDKWSNATHYYYYKEFLGMDEATAKKVVVWGAWQDITEGATDAKTRFENWLTNVVFLNSCRMTQNDMERFIRIINARKPDLIRGYASSLYELCNYAERKHIALYTPKRLVSTAESLMDEMRETIESSFGTKVFNFYGSREIGPIAGECRDGRMHFFPFWNHLEVLDENNRPVETGQEGKVVLTNLFNYAMPLIRYEIGDTAVLGPQQCTCDNPLPTLEKVTGRTLDRFLLENGTIIPGQFFICLIGAERNKGHIKEFQIIQTDYRKFEILYVPQGELPDSERRDFDSIIHGVIGDCIITWRCVDELPKTKTGKRIFTKSLVWK